MTAMETLRRGDTQGALRELKAQVRSKPQDAEARVFLFQLLAVLGQWDSAQTQLSLCGQLDPATELMVKAYTEAIRCEKLRGEILAGKRTPLVLGEPELWIASMIQALALQAGGQSEAAGKLRQQAFEAAPAVGGMIRWRASGSGADESLQCETFQWIADAETMLGPILEAMLDGRYYWVPLNHIDSIRLEPPSDLRDLVWMPAQFTWVGGGQQLGFIPTRYFGSEASEDDAIRLARKTDWVPHGDGFEVGRGQRLIATDVSEYPLLDIREITLNHTADPSPGEESPANG